MALPVTGPITIANINTELGVASNAQRSLGSASTRALFGMASGAISLGAGRGKANSYPAQTLTYDGSDRSASVAVTLEGGNAYNIAIDGSTAIQGARIQQLHIVCWGGGGAGATWPSGAAGGYGGAGYRISLIRSTSSAVAALLDSIASLTAQAGNAGTPWWSGRFGDNRQAGGAGGTSFVNFNGTRLITAKGGNGSRQIYNNGDGNYIHPTSSSSVGDNGGAGAGEGGSGSAATYGGGGGASNNSGGFGASTYGGRGGARVNGGLSGFAPGGGGGGIDNNSNRGAHGGIGRVAIYINTPAPF